MLPTFAAGITPTCMGNTLSKHRWRGGSQDHPHLCGEYESSKAELAAWKGSPPPAWGILIGLTTMQATQRIAPHTWGIPRFTKCCSRRAGITPTCVGNTKTPKTVEQVIEDHPHLRGEYQGKSHKHQNKQGSPPLAWGILELLKKSLEDDRITPTCVGNTIELTGRSMALRDHPHLRGEYTA